MHGLGNDFVVMENMNGRIKLTPEQIIFLCDRHKGIGADGVILIETKEGADCFMNYYNSDGTVAEMCGNGVRCVAKFFKDEILPKNSTQNNFKIATRAGIKEIEYLDDATFSVNMGKPVFSHKDFPGDSMEFENLKLDFVSMGNPHAVALVEDLEKYDLPVLGSEIENNKNFPNKINFELVQEISPKEFKVKVWERGSGITLACGTGACAVYAIVRKISDAEKEININLPGGNLLMSENLNGDIIMRGPAVAVCRGMVEIK